MGAIYQKSFGIPLLLSLAISLSACGGGGGGGGGGTSSTTAQPLVYSGNTNATVITTDNAKTLVSNIIGSNGTTNNVVAAGLITQQPSTQSTNWVRLGQRLDGVLRSALNSAADSLGSGALSMVSVNQTLNCDISGTVSVTGNLDNVTGTGTLNLTFNSCSNTDGWLNGDATYKIDAHDFTYNYDTDVTIGFTLLQVRGADYDVTISGSLRSQTTIAMNREQVSGGFVGRDNTNGEFAKIENLVTVTDYDSVLNPGSYSTTVVSERVFDATAGYVDVTTVTPWFYASLTQDFPSSGGALVLTGANNAHISVTPVSGTLAKVELDLDSNGIYELASTMPWTVLAGPPPVTNTAPTAYAGANQTVPKNTLVTLDGTGSSDAEYDFLTYQWTLVQKPGGSLAQLSGATGVHPTFTADRAGTYEINLIVSDGKLSSAASTVTITATDAAPVANAGAEQYLFLGAQAALDGSNSSDANGDSLTYNWSFTLKPQGSAVTLSNSATSTPVFTPDVAGTYRVSLTVNDGTVDSQPSSVTVYVVTAPASVAKWHVPADFSTIQAAIDAASPGDTISVTPGIYPENLRFNGKAVTLQSSSGPTKTIIEGQNDTAVVIGPGGAVIGFTIRKGTAYFGAGMAVTGTGTLIKQNIFESNTQYYGGYGAAIGGNVASPVIDSNIFRNNSCENDNQWTAGVISFINSSSPTILNNIIENNPCRAINMTIPSGSTPNVMNNTIVSNRTGIYVDRRTDASQQIYRNNLIVSNNIGLEIVFGTETYNPTWQNNLLFGNGTNYSGVTDKTGTSGNISVDPMLVDQAGGFYNLQTGSPAIDQGTNTGAPTVDFTGRPRPVDGNGDSNAVTDIGAFEYQTP